jgi:hypothetical protein
MVMFTMVSSLYICDRNEARGKWTAWLGLVLCSLKTDSRMQDVKQGRDASGEHNNAIQSNIMRGTLDGPCLQNMASHLLVALRPHLTPKDVLEFVPGMFAAVAVSAFSLNQSGNSLEGVCITTQKLLQILEDQHSSGNNAASIHPPLEGQDPLLELLSSMLLVEGEFPPLPPTSPRHLLIINAFWSWYVRIPSVSSSTEDLFSHQRLAM